MKIPAKILASFKRSPRKKKNLSSATPSRHGFDDDHDSPSPTPIPPPLSSISSPILPPEFFLVDALDLAPRLLGKLLRCDDVVLRITEVEAFRPNDAACHGRFGITAWTAPVFGPGGHVYVYLCSGLHMMLNVVADKVGVGAAGLFRSCAPIAGMETTQERRGQKTEKPVLLTGPGKINRMHCL